MSRPYANSLFDCCSPMDLCCKSFFCSCFVAGRNHHRIEHGNDDGYSSCNGWCCGWTCLACLGGWQFFLQVLDRNTMQKQHNLEGNACTGCLAAWCCGCCELIQTSKELDLVLNEKRHIEKGYQAPQGMVAEPLVGQSQQQIHHHQQQEFLGNKQQQAMGYN